MSPRTPILGVAAPFEPAQAARRLEWRMFFWFLVAVGAVVVLTVIGAMMVKRDPGTAWEIHEDRPIGPGTDL